MLAALVWVAGAGRLRLTLFVTKHGFAREFNLVALLANTLNKDLLTLLELIADVFNATVSNFRDMQEAVRTRKISTKAPKSTILDTVPR